jgi:hypothetical protein
MRPVKPRPAGGPHDALTRMMAQVAEAEGEAPEAGVLIAAEAEGVSKFTLYKQLDPDSGTDMSFVRVARLVGRFGTIEPARYLARLAGYILLKGSGRDWSATPLAALASVTKEGSEAIAAIAEVAGLGAGATATQRAKAAKEIDDAIEALYAARERIVPTNDGGRE